MKATAVLPVKRFAVAKRRLAAGIEDEQREALVAAMLGDVLEAIGEARSIERIVVVSDEPGAAAAAADAGAELIPDTPDAGHSEATLAGIARAVEHGAECVVLLPGDCPLLDPRELERLLTGVPERYAAIVPDRHGTGTNALVLAPPGSIRPAFGEGSCARHVAAAREAGVPFAVEEVVSLALDLDTPADVVALTRELAARPGRARRTAKVLKLVNEVNVLPIEDLPEFSAGMPVGEEIAARAELLDGDVVVVSQKIVSKAEGRVLRLSSAIPGAEARRLAAVLGNDPALVELILAESREVLRADRGVLIVETHHGFVCANAGIDSSNLPEPGTVALLPQDPDASARRIRAEIGAASARRVAVIVSDSFGRAWRLGQSEVAIGCAGIAPFDDWRGREDAGGRRLEATQIAVADEAAAAADLVRDKASRVPATVVRGLEHFVTEENGPGAAALRRPRDEDLFR